MYLQDDVSVETSRYAQQDLDSVPISPFSRKARWKPTTPDEMKVFFALTIAMGLVKKDDIDKYWSTDQVLDTPFFR
jgi:hypothetical protein